jgi:hypothetical protein
MPPQLPHLPPLLSDSFPAPPSQGMLLMESAQLTSDRLPGPPTQGMILTEPLPLTSDTYPQPGPQTELPPPAAPVPPSLPFILQ